MIQSKLFVLKQEIELLWTEMHYDREINRHGRPSSHIFGGDITVCFATRADSDMILHWMTKSSQDETALEQDKMEEGKICFYENGFEEPPTKTYEFNDSFSIMYKETFNAKGEEPFQTVLTISPAIQNYGVELIKTWNVSHISPMETNQTQETEEKTEPKFLGYHFEDDKGNKIEQTKISVNDVIYLYIETEHAEDDKITLNLDDDNMDYKHNGKLLENDVLKGVKVSGSMTKVKLTAVAQKKEATEEEE